MPRLSATDVTLAHFVEHACDGREVVIDVQHGQVVMNSGRTNHQVYWTGSPVLAVQRELVLRGIDPAGPLAENKNSVRVASQTCNAPDRT